MSVQTIANRWIEQGISQLGIKPILNNAFGELTIGGPGYCNKNTDNFTKLPGQPASASQIILDQMPYGPANCNQFATLIKPGVNPLTLRGKSNNGVTYPVDDKDVCLESCDYMLGLAPVHGICSEQCIRNTTFCGTGSTCQNNAPGGLADWMGRPKSGGNNDTWGSAVNNQLEGGKLGENNYFNPVRLVSENLMKNGFVTQGCECQGGTSRIGTFYDHAQLGPDSGPHTLSKDAAISSEVWNGQGNCSTWQNNSEKFTTSTCSLDIKKYAETCKWCKTAVLTVPGVQPDQTYPPHITKDNRDVFGAGTIITSPTSCGFSDLNGKYSIDKGDCLGYGVDGKPRIPCLHPVVENYDCPITNPIKQKIGLFCNVPAGSRLTGEACAFAQPQDLNYMTVTTGSDMNNYWVSYTNGSSFSVILSGSVNVSRTGNNDDFTGVITGGRQIAVTFPNGMLASTLMNNLKANAIFSAEIDVSMSLAANASLASPQNSIPPPISSIFNIQIQNFTKSTTIGNITYLLRYSSDYPGYNGSYLDGNIQIKYANGPLGMIITGNWSRSSLTDQSLNVVQITFPNGTDGTVLVNYINQQFQASSILAVRNLIASGGSGPQKSFNSVYYYGFSQGGNAKEGGSWYPGNCNVRLNGTVFPGPWTPTTQNTEDSWIGKQGIKCDYSPNEGYCQPMFYNPNATGDCQICDSDLWDWIPGGWEAVVDPSNTLHNLAVTTYIPKIQDLKHTSTCTQTNTGFGSDIHSVAYCGKDNANNRCTAVCGQGCANMSWDTTLSDNATVVDNIISETGGINNDIPTENCPDMLCERNPVLTLRGTSSQENHELVTNWMNGIFDLTTLHGRSSGIDLPIVPDLRAYGKPDELAKRTIKSMRCCLGVNPGFKSSDGGPNGSAKIEPEKDPYGGLEMWNLTDCPPGVMCPSSDTCKELYKSVLDGSNEHVTLNLNDFGASSYPSGFSLDSEATENVSEEILLNPAYYVKSYCEMMSGGSTKTLTPEMGLDDEINTLCRKTMYNYCMSPVTVDVINDGNYWNAPIGTISSENDKYSKTTYELPLKIFTQGCNMWFKNQLQEVMPSDYGTRDMLLGSACQRFQVDGWYNPIGPATSPLLQAFVTKDGKIKDKSGYVFDLSYVGSASATSGDGSIPGLLANTCNCFLLGSNCQGTGSSNCSYQYCGAGINTEVKIDTGNSSSVLNPLNSPVDLSPYTSKLGSDGKAIGDSSWTKYQDITAPSWSTGLDPTNFTCAKGTAPQGMTVSGNEAGGTSNCYTGCNYINEYDICWNASPTNRKYSGELLGGKTKWSCDFSETFETLNTCDPSKDTSYSCFGNCEHGTKKDGSPFPNCGTQTWFDDALNLNPGEIKVKKNRSPGRSDIMDTPYWQNFYSGASQQVSSASIPNIGSVYNPSRSILASDSTCGSPNSIKPYNSAFVSQNQCVISQSISLNNQGTITGSVGLGQIGSCNVSDIFQGHDKLAFLTYMGASDCQNSSCWDNNAFCLTDGSTTNQDGIPAGENCISCGNSNSGLALVSAPTKPNTCCLDPSLSSLSSLSSSSSKEYQTANANILNAVTLGDKPVVSYFCSSGTCPIGSTDLATLQSTCGPSFTCANSTDQETCEGCDYCKWQPIYKVGIIDTGSKHCVAVCPTAPQNGWVSGGIKPTFPPTSPPIPTSPPTSPPTSSNLSDGDIALITIGVIIFMMFIVNLGVSTYPSSTKRSFGAKVGKIAKVGKVGKIAKVGKRIKF